MKNTWNQMCTPAAKSVMGQEAQSLDVPEVSEFKRKIINVTCAQAVNRYSLESLDQRIWLEMERTCTLWASLMISASYWFFTNFDKTLGTFQNDDFTSGPSWQELILVARIIARECDAKREEFLLQVTVLYEFLVTRQVVVWFSATRLLPDCWDMAAIWWAIFWYLPEFQWLPYQGSLVAGLV